jgi:hypothetical protein
MILKDVEESGRGLFKHISYCLEGLRKTTKNASFSIVDSVEI